MHSAHLIFHPNPVQSTRVLCLLLSLILLVIPCSAYSNQSLQNSSEVNPEEDGEFTAFDFFVGGRYIGLAYGFFGKNWIALETPSDILPLLPAVKDRNALLPLFSGIINEPRQIKGVGSLRTDINSFQIHLDVAEALSLTNDVSDMESLPKPKKILALRNKFILTGSTSFDVEDSQGHGSLNHNTLFGRGRTRVSSIGTYNEATGNYEIVAASVDRDLKYFNQHMTLSNGLLETSGQQFARSLSILGIRLGSNRTLVDRDPLLKASRIEVFIPTRSRLDIFKAPQNSGRLLYSSISEFGTSEIDTRSFPLGTYNIEIVLSDSKGNVQSEIRPFTKSTHLAPRVHPEISFELGTIRDKLHFTDQPVGFASIRKRLLDWADGSISFYSSTDAFIVETSSNIEFSAQVFQLPGDMKSNLNLSISHHGLLGASTYLEWNDQKYSGRIAASKSFNKIIVEDEAENIDLTPIENNADLLNQSLFENEIDPATSLATALNLQARETINLNLSGPIAFRQNTGRLLFNCFWSQNDKQPSNYYFGPELSFNVFKKYKYRTELKMQWITNKDTDANFFISISTQSKKSKNPKQSQISFVNNSSGYALDAQASLNLRGKDSAQAWRKNLDANSTLHLDDIASDYQKLKVSMNNNIQYSGPWVSANTYLNTNLNNFSGHLGGEISSTIIWNEEGILEASGEKMSREKALLVVQAKGEGNSRLSIQVDRSHKAFIYPGEKVIISIPTYKTSTIQLTARDETPILIKEAQRSLTAYPGNVFEEVFYFQKMLLIFGRLVDRSGEPIINRRFISPGGVSYTDDEGYFDIEAPGAEKDTFIIETKKMRCSTTLENLAPDDIFYEMGGIVCHANPIK